MAFQEVFKRFEFKYMITVKQKEKILDAMAFYMIPDEYGKTTIRNIYYDTNTYLLIRRSIEKPIYKEKLRIRSYERAEDDSTVFVELKKKYQKIVYKRRVSLTEKEAVQWLEQEQHCQQSTQIVSEIDYFLDFYKTLTPKIFLSYEREAFYAKDDSGLRITFDENILWRQEELSLEADIYGNEILPENTVLMEIKCSGGIPLWMVQILSQEGIYKTSFSKYGEAYKTMILS